MVLLKKLLNNLAFHSPAILSSEEGEKYPKEFEILLSLGILKQDTFPQERWCPSCESESLPIQTISKERAYTLCTMDEEATRDYFDPQILKQWRFTTPPFITLFFKALGIEQKKPTETIAGLLWNLGTHEINGNQYHLFFTRNIANIEEDKCSIITSTTNTVVFYLGTVRTALPDGILAVPILGTIKDLKSGGFVLAHEALNSYFSDAVLLQKKARATPPSKRELRKKINNIIKTGKFGKKERALLKHLTKDFEPVTIEETSKEVATKACTKLKARVQKKLKGTGFNIKTDKGGWGRKATYQLVYLLTSENS